MKILSLEIKNIASITDATIDFTAEPLNSAGLIAITGPTGSGKSTLLDAICLAFFDKTPRLKSGMAENAPLVDEYSKKEMKVLDTLQLLRRGTTQGYVKVRFIASGGNEYECHWEARRVRNKIGGKVQKEVALRCITDGSVMVEKKITEYTNKMEQLIGLSFEQFTRAVMLAQSEVGAFLKAKDDERANLLEYLTNSHIFSEISIVSYEKTKACKEEQQKLDALIGNINILSEEQRQQLDNDLSTQQSHIEQCKADLQTWENKQRDCVQYEQLQRDLLQVKQQQEQHLAQQGEIEKDEQNVQRGNALKEIRASVEQQQTLASKQQQYQQECMALEQQAKQVNEQFSQAKKAYDDSVTAYKNEQAQQQHLAPQLQALERMELRRIDLRGQYEKTNSEKMQFEKTQIVPKKQQLQVLQQEIAGNQTAQEQCTQALAETADLASFDAEPKAIQATLQQFLTHHQHILQFFDGQLPDEQTLQKKWQQTEQQYKELQQHGTLSAVQQQYDQAEQAYQQYAQQAKDLDRAIEQVKNAEHTVQQGMDLQQELQLTQQNLKQSRLQEQNLLQAHQQAEAHLKQVDEILQQQRLLFTESVQHLRQNLQPDQPCLVCGSKEHPYVTEQLEKSMLAVQEQQQQQALQQCNDARDAWQEQNQQCVTLAASLQSLQQQLEKQLQQETNLQAKVQHALNTAQVKYDVVAMWSVQNLAQLVQQLEQTQQNATAQEQRYQQQKTQLKKTVTLYQKVSEQYQQQRPEQEKWQAYQAEIERVQHTLEPHLQTLWLEQTAQIAEQWLQAIPKRQKDLQALQELQAKADAQQQTQAQYANDLQHLQNHLQHMDKQLGEIKQEGIDLKATAEDLLNTHIPQLGFNPQVNNAEQWKAHLQQALSQLEQQQEQALTHYQQLQNQKGEAEKLLASKQTEQQTTSKHLLEVSNILSQWLANNPTWQQQDLTQAIQDYSDATLSALTQKIEHYQRQGVQ
ncbi:MAG: AAA family ATPase, partial [Acinetobacter sp.]|nr:AAA family ATPase [Acinetobacter sp.]